jgi:hypothetical protein
MLPNPNPSQGNAASNIRNRMIAISGVARANGGLIKQFSGSITTETPRVKKALPISVVVSGQGVYEVGIDPCESVTFDLSWENSADELSFALVTPAGDIITPDSHPANVEVISSPKRPYLGLRVNQPVAGTWKIAVRPIKLADITAYFQLFVFGENQRISGGITSPKRFYDIGDIIPLQFQSYYGPPITGLKVSAQFARPDGSAGLPIEFRDDEKKDLRAGRPGNGIYTGSLRDTLIPGLYTIVATADNSEGKATYTEPVDNFPQIPAFRRDYMITLAVGQQPVQRIATEPSNGYPGGKLQTTIKGNLTHFKQGFTSFDFGEGISVEGVQIKDHLTAFVTVSIGRAATIGTRAVTATTDKEVVKTEEGFQVVRRPHDRCKKSAAQLAVCALAFVMSLLLLVMLLLGRRKVSWNRRDPS